MLIQNNSVYTQPASQAQAEFPGKRANFVQSSKWEDWQENVGPLVKMLKFKSETPDSFFQEVNVVGYHTFGLHNLNYLRDGQIQISVVFSKEQPKATKNACLTSFAQAGLNFLENQLDSGHLQVSDSEQKKKLVNFLIANNTFPADQIELMHSLTQTEDWRELEPNQDFLKNIRATAKMVSQISQDHFKGVGEPRAISLREEPVWIRLDKSKLI